MAKMSKDDKIEVLLEALQQIAKIGEQEAIDVQARDNMAAWARTALKQVQASKRTGYEVIVGNIGSVYSGDSKAEADHEFRAYATQSMDNRGRAGGEDVTLLVDGEVVKEHLGPRSMEEQGRD